MLIKEVKINEFRSFGSSDNCINLGGINTIIGVNESGKSNLIRALSGLSLTGINNSDFFKEENNIHHKTPSFELKLVPYKSEIKKFNISENETKICIKSQYDISVDGGFSEYIFQNEKFQKDKKELINELGNVVSKINDTNRKNNLNDLVNQIKNSDKKIFIYYTSIDGLIDYLNKIETIQGFVEVLRNCVDFLSNTNRLLPNLISLNDLNLKTKYTLNDLKDGQKPKKALMALLKSIDMDLDDLLEFWKYSREDDKENFENHINETINDNLITKFNAFYGAEIIRMKVRLNADSISFLVQSSDGKSVNYEERSNGLKWYLMAFIQMMTKIDDSSDFNNKVLLLDEPGVFLHVNAQKKILDLFEHLRMKGNQIVYTTHLPTMIYENSLDRIRLIFALFKISADFCLNFRKCHSDIQNMHHIKILAEAAYRYSM